MITAKNVAEYFLSKDPDRRLFNKNVVVYNDRKFYEGNARLNKYLFLSQVVHLAKYDCKLFEDNFSGDVNAYQEYHALIVEHGKNCYLKKPYGAEDRILDEFKI